MSDVRNTARRERGRALGLLRTGAVGVGVVLTAVACGGSAAGRSTPTASAASSGEAASTPTASTHPSTTPAASGTGTAAAPPGSPSVSPARCTHDRLRLSLGRVSPGAGNRYAPLVFTNTGTRPCSLHGYPGVTLLDSAGDRIGEPARRRGPDAGPLTLEPGGSVHAALHTVAEGVTNEPCRPPAAQVQAYPPGSTRALRAPADSFRVCGGVFEVGAVEPGEHP